MSGTRTTPLEVTVTDLLKLIDDLDQIDEDDYLDLSRFNRQGSGEDDPHFRALIRQLARERLGAFPVEDVGLEVLRRIDQREPV